jgi:type I restriction enzyme S subunit
VTVLLKHVAQVRVSNVDKKSYGGEATVRLCNYTDVYYGDRIWSDVGDYMLATASAEQRRKFTLEAGDTVLTKDSETPDDIGVSAYIESSAPDFVCGYHLAIVRPAPAVANPRFISWLLCSGPSRDQLAIAATGVTRYGLRTEALANLHLHLPPLEVQRRVADFLDVQVAFLDNAIQLRQKQLELVLGRVRSTGEHVVGSLGSVRRVRVGWVARELDVRAEAVPDGPGNLLLSVSIHHGVVPRDEITDRQSRADDLGHYKVCWPDDIVVNRMRAFHGGIGVARQQGLVSPDYTVMRLGESARAEFLNLIFRSPWFVGQMTSRLRGIGGVDQGAVRTPRINWADLKLIEIPLPSVREQDAIIRESAAVERDSREGALLLQRSLALLRERKQALITAAVTGEFDVSTASVRSVA